MLLLSPNQQHQNIKVWRCSWLGTACCLHAVMVSREHCCGSCLHAVMVSREHCCDSTFIQAGCRSCCLAYSIKALKANYIDNDIVLNKINHHFLKNVLAININPNMWSNFGAKYIVPLSTFCSTPSWLAVPSYLLFAWRSGCGESMTQIVVWPLVVSKYCTLCLYCLHCAQSSVVHDFTSLLPRTF